MAYVIQAGSWRSAEMVERYTRQGAKVHWPRTWIVPLGPAVTPGSCISVLAIELFYCQADPKAADDTWFGASAKFKPIAENFVFLLENGTRQGGPSPKGLSIRRG